MRMRALAWASSIVSARVRRARSLLVRYPTRIWKECEHWANLLGEWVPVDTLAFGLGAGIAGLGGVALSQIANVGPDMGQGYIVDSFLVVVVGGVGQLAGAVWAALGLGVIAKFLEGWTGAVIAKIAVLVFVIIFIQKRPQGIFALKGRFVES